MPKPVLGGRQEVPTRTVRGSPVRHTKNPENTKAEGKSKVETGAEVNAASFATKPKSNILTPRAHELRNEVSPCISSLKARGHHRAASGHVGDDPSHTSVGQQRSTQKNPHRDAMQRPTNSHMRARYQCEIKRRYIVTGRMSKTELEGPSEVGAEKEKELIAQRTEKNPRNQGKDTRENRKDRQRAG